MDQQEINISFPFEVPDDNNKYYWQERSSKNENPMIYSL